MYIYVYSSIIDSSQKVETKYLWKDNVETYIDNVVYT